MVKTRETDGHTDKEICITVMFYHVLCHAELTTVWSSPS